MPNPTERVLTPNPLAARLWRERHTRERRARGEPAGEAAPVTHWSAFVTGLFHEAAVVHAPLRNLMLLGEHQELLLWEAIIADDAARQDLDADILDLGTLAQRARGAYRVAVQWNLAADTPAFGEDRIAFRRWHRRFERRCRDDGLLPGAAVENVLAERGGELPVDGVLRLIGFEERLPARDRLLRRLAHERIPAAGATTAPPPRLQLFQTPGDEIAAIARHAADLLDRHPGHTLGVVLAAPPSERTTFADALQRQIHADRPQLAPGFVYCTSGPPLDHHPMVREALLRLRAWVDARLAFHEFVECLNGTCMAPLDLPARIAAEQAVRRFGAGWIDAEVLRRIDGLGRLSRQLFGDHALPARGSPVDYSTRFAHYLGRAGWPGRVDDEDSAAVAAAVDDSLGRLADTAIVDPWTTPSRALSRLGRILASGRAAPPWRGPGVVVMGVEETPGTRFDACWIADMSERAWPGPQRPEPLLPPSAQRDAGYPPAVPERWRALALARYTGLTRRCDALHASVALQSQDESRPGSRFPGAWPSSPASIPAAPAGIRTEPIDDQAAPVPDAAITGGLGVLADQAACPFRAFARHRLRARAGEQPVPGEDPRVRGDLLHRVMEEFWRRTGSREGLLTQTHDACRRLLESLLEQAISRARHASDTGFGPGLDDIEKAVYVDALAALIDRERMRPPFRIEALEARHRLCLAGITLNLRIDRVDTLDDGSMMVIDYKSGPAAMPRWLEPRLREPQLPAYRKLLGENCRALTLASLDPAAPGFTGIAACAPGIEGIRAAESLRGWPPGQDWDTLAATWDEKLESIAAEFRSGVADVTPLDQACHYCDLQALCRVPGALETADSADA